MDFKKMTSLINQNECEIIIIFFKERKWLLRAEPSKKRREKGAAGHFRHMGSGGA